MTSGDRLPLEERLHQFVDELRARGIPVATGERVDAFRAVRGLDLSHSERLHTALQATTVKDAGHLTAFDAAYDLFFRTGGGPTPGAAEDDDGDLGADVEAVLATGDVGLARRLAEDAVSRYARIEPGRRVAGVLYERWTLDALGLADGAAPEGDVGGRGGPGGAGGEGAGSGSGDAGGRARNADLLRAQVVAVIRDRMVADRGPADVARVLRRPLPADVDLTAAAAAELAAIEATVPALQRKLATALRRRRRQARGPLDVRATLRRSAAYGGVPVTPVERPARPTRPRLLVLADVSGSVASFASFAVSFVAAMTDSFSGQRTFVFVRDVAEVSDLVRAARSPREAALGVRDGITRASLGPSTDYGRSLTAFRDAVRADLGHRTTVLVLGDARGNHAPPRVEVLAELARRAGAVYWLNPEPVTLWGSGDSDAPLYARACTAMVTCRTVADLRRFVARLA